MISILVPCYNESSSVALILDKVMNCANSSFNRYEIIVVDDGSTDGTFEILKKFADQGSILLLAHSCNKGKGASIRTALKKVKGDIVIIQDSDQEYDPQDYQDLVDPILQDQADVVFGSRFKKGKPNRSIYWQYAIGNKLISSFCSLLTGLKLTDIETGYKVIRFEYLKKIELEQNRFGIEPELTVKLSKIPEIRFQEVGISYFGRSFEEGKKIRWWDGALAFYYIIKYSLFSSKPRISFS